MEFLKSILGNELYDQVEEKVNAHNAEAGNKNKQIKIENISSGEYVSKEKYSTLKTKADGLDEQLKAANTDIKSYKDLDIDGIKQKAQEWETKYTTDTAALEEKMNQQAYGFEAERYIGKYKFSSELAKDAAIQKFTEKKFQFENGSFLGADDFMKQMKESNPAAFVAENSDPNQGKTKLPTFTRGTTGSFKPQTVGDEKAYMDQKYASNPYYNKQ